MSNEKNNNNDANNLHLDPATRSAVNRLKQKSKVLQSNGNSSDPELMGRTLAEIADLFAMYIENQPPSHGYCLETQKELYRYIDESVKKARRGINWPTAITIITSLLLTVGSGVILSVIKVASGG